MSRHRPKKNFWVKFWVMFFEMHSVLCHFFFNLKNDTKKIKTECIQCFCVIWRDLWLVAVVSFFLNFFIFLIFCVLWRDLWLVAVLLGKLMLV
jgi:hypothetical protein